MFILRKTLFFFLILLICTVAQVTILPVLLHPTEFIVLVVGNVMAPGIYTATPNTRIYQLVNKAGGANDTADLTAINLAAKVRSRWVWVPGK